MKTKRKLSIILLSFIFSSCYAPEYLPTVENIDVSEFGSYIEIENNNGKELEGELISIDSISIIVLTCSDSIKTIIVSPLTEVSSFRLKYAQPKDYSWQIPVYTLSTILHGYFLILTAPINLIVTTTVNARGSMDFEYTESDMTFDKLKMFARFPQGIPPNINLASLK